MWNKDGDLPKDTNAKSLKMFDFSAIDFDTDTVIAINLGKLLKVRISIRRLQLM